MNTVSSNELRKGNLVRLCFDKVEGWHLSEVTAIHEDGSISTTTSLNNGREYYWEPVIIDNELLERFGFKKEPLAYTKNIDSFGKGKRLSFSGDYLYIIDAEAQNTIPTDIITIWNKDLMKKFYAHSLQNLWLTLTGTELKFI